MATMPTMETENITNETRLTRIQAIVVEILNDLLRAPIDETDAAIDRAIARIGTYCLRDRAYVFVNGEGCTSNTHEWCAEGIDPAIDQLQELPWELYGPIYDTLHAGQTFHVPDVSALEPGSPTRESLEEQEIRSIIMVPMHWDGRFYGILGFDGVHNTHAFLPGEIYLLRSVADVICSVLTRRDSDRAMRKAQDALTGERAFLESILTTSAMGMLVMDDAGTVSFANEAAAALLGTSAASLTGMHHTALHDWLEPADECDESPADKEERAPVALVDAKALGGETPFEMVKRSGGPVSDIRFALKHGEGPPRYCAIHAASVRGQRRDARVVYALLDVTEQVTAERTREAALDEARRANLAKSQFLAKMSHEMRTPLNGVLGIAEVLDRLVDDPDQRRMVKMMHDSGSLLLNIINDLLDMSKIEADRLAIEQVPFDMNELAQRVEAVHTLKAAEKALSFAVTLNGKEQALRLGDPYRLLQILHNVIGNAVKFTPSGTVRVSMDCSDPSRVQIMVSDTGIGMTVEQQTQVFEEFGQADGSIARKFGGTGLGMPIVRRLVEMMGGSIGIDSAPGKGTQVIISLPLAVLAEGTNMPAAPAIDEHELDGLRVLAADDNRTNLMILGAMLGQLGVTSTLTPDGPTALDAFERENFDAVILDISMPEMDGVEVLKEIRKREYGSGRRIPVLAFTANAMSHQVEAYLQAGFDDCLTKPLHIERLRSALGAIFSRANGASAARLASGEKAPPDQPLRAAGRFRLV